MQLEKREQRHFHDSDFPPWGSEAGLGGRTVPCRCEMLTGETEQAGPGLVIQWGISRAWLERESPLSGFPPPWAARDWTLFYSEARRWVGTPLV